MDQRYEREHWDRRDGRERGRPAFNAGYGRAQEPRGYRREGERLVDERRFAERSSALEPWSHRHEDDRRRAAIRAYDPGEYGEYGNASRDERGGRGFAPEGDEDLGVFSGYGGYGGGQDGEDDHPGYGREEQRRYSESRGTRNAGRERDFREGRFGGVPERRFGDPGELRVSSRRDETRGDRGAHVGRGPREYQRSDERIREDACDRLTDSGEVDATNLSVQVSNGEITIEGEVPSRRMKRAAEDCVDDISGVKQVHNHLRVSSNGHSTTTTLL